MKNDVLKYFLCFWGICIGDTVLGQNFEGHWQGTNHSPGSATSEYWPVSLTLTQVGNNLNGIMHFSARGMPQYYVTFEVTGRVTGANSFWLDITNITDENKENPDNIWCYGEGNFSLDQSEGKFTGVINFSNCPFQGQTELYRLELISDRSFCQMAIADLEVTGSNVRWYADEEKKTLIHSGNRFSTRLMETTTYYVTQTHNATESPVLPIVAEVMKLDFESNTLVECGATSGTISLSSSIQEVQYRLNQQEFLRQSTFESLSFGTYTITARAGECQFEKEVKLDPKTAPAISGIVTERVSCAGNDGTLTINASGVPPLTYALNDGEFQSENQFTGLSAGFHEIHVKNSGECITTDTVEVLTVENLPQITSVDAYDPTCGNVNGRILVNATEGMQPLSYSLDGITYLPASSFDSLSNGEYTVYVKDAADCSVSEEVTLQAAAPIGDIFCDLKTASCGNADGEISIREPQSAYVLFSLDNSAASTNRIYQNLPPGNYHLLASDENGCTSETDVEIIQNCTIPVNFPTALTPNGDAMNDTFTAFFNTEKLLVVRFAVFNRWGNLVFNKEGFELKSGELLWDGKVADNQAHPGLYNYLMQVNYEDEETHTYKGSVQILR